MLYISVGYFCYYFYVSCTGSCSRSTNFGVASYIPQSPSLFHIIPFHRVIAHYFFVCTNRADLLYLNSYIKRETKSIIYRC